MCLSVNPSNSLVSRALLQIQRNLSKSPSAFTQQRPVETAEHGRDSTIQTLFPRPSYPECWGLTNIASGLGGGRCAKVRNRRGLPISEACVHRGKMIDSCWESVTGQRSNQLNYVPNLFSYLYRKPTCLVAFLRFNRFAYVACFNPVEPNSEVNGHHGHQAQPLSKKLGYRQHEPRAAVPAPCMNCSRGNSDQYRRSDCGNVSDNRVSTIFHGKMSTDFA